VTEPGAPGDRSRATGSRLALALVGLGLLLASTPAAAQSPSGEAAAVDLLEHAARASAELSYAGTKYVAAWRQGGASTALVEVRHEAGRGTVLTTAPTAGGPGEDDGLVLAATRLDPALLRTLRDTYDLRVAGTGSCAGRQADVVEARREGAVAGRFWIDRETGLLLRREVYDEAGRRVRSSAFVDLLVVPSGAAPTIAPASRARPLTAGTGDRVTDGRLEALRREGWTLPERLPGGFVLFDARRHGDGEQVLHLAYSDGLSTTSLFVQRGEPGSEPPDGFSTHDVEGHRVWAHGGAPARMVWAGDGRVWTVVSDAPDGAVTSAVAALPHDPMPEQGLRARLARGLSRLAGWLNPFD
jgi:sigma-E factor negative regulatory protein RseB